MRYSNYIFVVVSCALLLLRINIFAQKTNSKKDNSLVYVDKNGTMRWKTDNTEASFFGVNYTTPFAYAYRAHNALHVDLEKAIQQDVYHMARLGLDAFRVHVWDTEISDVSGKLLENDHLRLFDFLLAELKKRNIKIIITPIAFWGNGYPEHDEATPGFSRFYGRGKLTTNDSAIVAQENYLREFFAHVNKYTGLAYKDDPDVIAVELNNEPSHSGPKAGVTTYINRLAAAVRNAGWSKPLFYNISQGPYYADAVAASTVDGFSFQWYPAGLVSGSELKGNYLPNVDRYTIPFDTIASFAKKARMVYEFDAADILSSYMYPAMARSFKEAGFQWATQFAYDPMALAYANTEYQTHYLNLAYTPSKAVSMLIASKVFHKLPRLKSYGAYPADSLFDSFRVSYKQALSEMNTQQEFYYSNSTETRPLDVSKLQHLAGVGSSSTVRYEGSGAYFLDQLEDGVWRLEVMPDAISIRDPFEKPSPEKEVTRIQWRENTMQITMTDLGSSFRIEGLNKGNAYAATADQTGFKIHPGTYLLTRNGKKFSGGKKAVGVIALSEFVAPPPSLTEMFLRHSPFIQVCSNKSFVISATVVGIDGGEVTLLIGRKGERVKSIPMDHKAGFEFIAAVPADMVTPGMLNYRIALHKGDAYSVFPGNNKGDPFAWDNYHSDSWRTFVMDENSKLEIFNPTVDQSISTYADNYRNFHARYVTGDKPDRLILQLSSSEWNGRHTFGFQYAFASKNANCPLFINTFDHLVIRARLTNAQSVKAKVVLTNEDAFSVSSFLNLSGSFQDFEIPLGDMIPDVALLMPRPYPGFMPLRFKAGGLTTSKFAHPEKIEIVIGPDAMLESMKSCTVEVESIWLQKGNGDLKQ